MSKKIFYGWWIVLACFIVSFYFGGVVFYSFTAFFEPIREEFGWSYAQISLATSLRGLEMGILAPLVGFLVDRFGSRKIILCGTVTVGLGLITLSMTQSLFMFYMAFVLLAFGAGGCTSVVTMTVVTNWFHKRLGLALGIMVSGFGAGGLLVPVIVKFITLYGWRNTLVILGIGIWVLGVPMAFVIRDSPEKYGCLPDGLESLPSDLGAKEEPDDKDWAFKEVIKKKGFWYLNLTEAVRMVVLTSVVIHVMPYLSDLGFERSVGGFVAAGIPLISILGRFGFGWFSDFFDKRYVMAAAFCFMAAGMVAFRFINGTGLVMLFLFLYSPGIGGGMVLRGAILKKYFGRQSFGKLLGITLGSASIGGIIGPTIAGWAFDVLGSYDIVWSGFCVLLAVSIIFIMRIKGSAENY